MEQLRKPGTSNLMGYSASEIELSRTVVGAISAGLVSHRKIESVFVPVRLIRLALHCPFVSGCVARMVLIAIVAGCHGHQVFHSHLLLAIIHVGKGLTLWK